MRRRLVNAVTVLAALLGVAMFQAGAVSAVTPGPASSRTDTTTCPVGAFCVWPTSDYQGQRFAFYACGIDFSNPYANDEAASWKNDQTPQGPGGPAVKMLGSDKHLIYTTPPPWSAKFSFSWTEIYYFRIC